MGDMSIGLYKRSRMEGLRKCARDSIPLISYSIYGTSKVDLIEHFSKLYLCVHLSV